MCIIGDNVVTCGYLNVDMRGFMTAHGQPDEARSARYILKDYVNVSVIAISTVEFT